MLQRRKPLLKVRFLIWKVKFKSAVWALFGQKSQARIPLSVSIANPDFEEDKQLLQKISADGVR